MTQPAHESVHRDMIADRIIARLPDVSATDLARVLSLVSQSADEKEWLGYAMSRLSTVDTYRTKLRELQKVPLIEQKSAEWHRVRQTIVTASDFAQALGEGKFGTQREFLVKKAGYVEVPFDSECPPLKWGVMFEDVACSIYERRNSIKVHPFGLLKHPNIPHFGASPDGITSNGVMLEIKCPFRRKISNEVPIQYYYQIQGQLDVCDLDECDFLECEFRVVETIDELKRLPLPCEIGIIYEDAASTDVGPGRYAYSPVFSSRNVDELEAYVAGVQAQYAGRKRHIWYLDVYNVIRVFRDKEFLREKFAELGEMWKKVESYRQDRALYDKEVTARAPRSAATYGKVASRGGGGVVSGYGFIGDE